MNNLLVISNLGLLFYKPETGVFLEFGENSGLSYQYPALNAVFTDKEGQIWIGTETGIIKYNPDYLHFIENNPRVFFQLRIHSMIPIIKGRKKVQIQGKQFHFWVYRHLVQQSGRIEIQVYA